MYEPSNVKSIETSSSPLVCMMISGSHSGVETSDFQSTVSSNVVSARVHMEVSCTQAVATFIMEGPSGLNKESMNFPTYINRGGVASCA